MASDQVQRVALRTAVERLSVRELEVLQLVSNGSTNSEIGGDLGLSIHAIKFHLTSVYRKLGVANRTEAAVAFVNADADRFAASRTDVG